MKGSFITDGSVPEQGPLALRRFHQARWDEKLIFELSCKGQRGILVPLPEPEMVAALGCGGDELVPEPLRRQDPPELPEMAQVHVLRHYLRLSQETLGVDLNIDVGQGTCTLKYSPKVNDRLSRNPKLADLHPLQDPSTFQGTLEILWNLERMLAEITGMDAVTLQPGGGSAAIYANASMLRAYLIDRGEWPARNEVVTTIFSHPSNAACAQTAGFKVVTLFPDECGVPTLDALRAAVSDRTAGLFITGPEDTGIYNPDLARFVDVVHDAGGLCVYDQANANGVIGVVRVRDAGFDMCQLNLHKTFSTPHSCGGPVAGVCAVTDKLAPFLPRPVVRRDGSRYYLDYDLPKSIGKIRPFYGVIPHLVRAYAWIMALGADGLRQVAETAVLNNNYLMKRMSEIPGCTIPFPARPRIEQVRYSWVNLYETTGVHSEDLGRRAADFGVHYWTSHHPFVVPEPCTLEPTEAYSKEDLDEYAQIIRCVAAEATEQPEVVKAAPHRSCVHKVLDVGALEDIEHAQLSWRARKRLQGDAG